MTGYQFDQSKNPNFVAVVKLPAKAGLLTGIIGLENYRPLSPQDDKNNFQPRIGARVRRPRQRQGRRPRRLGHLHRLRLHELERPVRGGRRERAAASGRCSASTCRPASGTPTAASTGPASRSRTSRARTRSSAPARSRCSASGSTRGSQQPYHDADQRRLVARADAEHGGDRRLRPLASAAT